jgi:hypothetical protein
MQSSLIGKIEKAKRYAQETDRITFSDFSVKFRGEHDNYVTSLKDGKWNCTCGFFGTWKVCSHTMAMERVLGNMLPKEVLSNTYINSAP